MSAPARSWARTLRFQLTEAGRLAEAGYRAELHTQAAQSGRGGFDAARAAWAREHGLEADDGLYLAELAAGMQSLASVVEALETCGKSRADAQAALTRLLDRGFAHSG